MTSIKRFFISRLSAAAIVAIAAGKLRVYLRLVPEDKEAREILRSLTGQR